MTLRVKQLFFGLCAALVALFALPLEQSQAQRSAGHASDLHDSGAFRSYSPPAGHGMRHWVELGRMRVDFFKISRKTVRVGRRAGRFNTFRVDVDKGEVFLAVVKIVYGNGDVHVFRPRQVLSRRSGGLIFDLQGRNRRINSVTLTLRGFPGFKGRPRVVLYGSQRRLLRGREHPPVAQLPRWFSAGVLEVPRRSTRLVLRVGRDKGRFDKVKIAITNNNVRFSSVRVVFGNGRVQSLPMGAGYWGPRDSRVFDLDGRARFIRRIEVNARTRKRGGKTVARVHVKLHRAGFARHVQDDPPPHRRQPHHPPRPPHHPPVDFQNVKGWQHLATRRVRFPVVRRDEVRLGRGLGRFDKIGLRVSRGDIFLATVEIVYANGETERRFPRRGVNAGETLVIDLQEKRRLIRKVVMQYRGIPGFGRTPRVELWGYNGRARGGGHDPRGGHDLRGKVVDFDVTRDWERLATRRIGFFVIRRDVIDIERNEGRFDKLGIRVSRGDIFLATVQIVYGNGKVETLYPRRSLDAGQALVLELAGRGRYIRQVVMKHRGIPGFGGAPRVELWGHHPRGAGHGGGHGYGVHDEDDHNTRGAPYERVPRGWDVLADEPLARRGGKRTVILDYQDRHYDALRMFIADAGVEVYDFDVIYTDGRSKDIEVRERFAPGTGTRVLELPRRFRGLHLKAVRINYDPLRRRGPRPRVIIWGRRPH